MLMYLQKHAQCTYIVHIIIIIIIIIIMFTFNSIRIVMDKRHNQTSYVPSVILI